MEKQSVDTYTTQEVLKGKSHQEIYDHIITTSTFRIHDVAEIVRRIPTLEKRKKYVFSQTLFLVLIGLFIAGKIISGFGTWVFFNQLHIRMALFDITVSLFLFYGVATYKRNMHLVAGLWMIYGVLMNTSGLMTNLYTAKIVGLLITIFATSIAFYLNSKLPGDYVINKELQKSNPEQRENLITFID
jgi:hypothetical protein